MLDGVIRLVVVEPSPIVLRGLVGSFSELREFQVVGSFTDLLRMEERIYSLRPAVLVINPIVVDYSKRDKLAQLFSTMSVVGISYFPIDPIVQNSLTTWISLYDTPPMLLIKIANLIEKEDTESDELPVADELSEREKDILTLLVKGMINKEIASALNISVHTVISHRKNICRKTGIKSVSGLTVYAMLNHIVDN